MPSRLLLLSVLIGQQPDFDLVANTRELMDAIIIPASDVLFNVPIDPPTDEAGWTFVENNAILLAESGNLLLLRAEDRGPWTQASEALVAAGQASLAAARNRNVDGFVDLRDTILTACSNCHDVYLE